MHPLAAADSSSALGVWAYLAVLAATAVGYVGIPFIGAAASGYGFSGRPTPTGCSPDRITRAWAELMRQLGYQRRRVSSPGFRRTPAMRHNYGTGAV
jgi:hypothetical protein